MAKSEDRVRKRRIAEAMMLVAAGVAPAEAAKQAGCSVRAVEQRLRDAERVDVVPCHDPEGRGLHPSAADVVGTMPHPDEAEIDLAWKRRRAARNES